MPGPNLGRCCNCETYENVRNLIMIEKKAPKPGTGWGCLQCGLASDGAMAVLCDACAEIRPFPVKLACVNYPDRDERIPIESLFGEHKHDMSKHPEERE